MVVEAHSQWQGLHLIKSQGAVKVQGKKLLRFGRERIMAGIGDSLTWADMSNGDK